jgi:hypothetical protein
MNKLKTIAIGYSDIKKNNEHVLVGKSPPRFY